MASLWQLILRATLCLFNSYPGEVLLMLEFPFEHPNLLPVPLFFPPGAFS